VSGDVEAPSAFRLYVAIVNGHFVLEADHAVAYRSRRSTRWLRRPHVGLTRSI
jgi:hypothetical protein